MIEILLRGALSMYFTPNKDFKICHDDDYPKFIEEITPILENCSVTGDFASFDGLTLRYRYFKVENAKASIVVLHGVTEFLQKYYEMAWYFLNSGYNVFLFDQRGHGYSGREVPGEHLTHVKDFEDYVKDLDALIKGLVEPNSDGAPVYLMSHSMGGAVVFLYLAEFENNIRKAVFCSPMIQPRTSFIPRPMTLRFVKKQIKKEGLEARFIHSGQWDPNPVFDKSTDMSYYRFLTNLNTRRADWHYQNSSSSNAWLLEAVNVRDKLLDKKLMSKIKTKMLLMCSKDDKLVVTKTTYKFARSNPNITLLEIPNSKHTIYTSSHEAIETFYKNAIDFFDK